MIRGLICEGVLLMKKLLHNKNFYLVLALIAAAIILLVAGRLIDFTPDTLPVITTPPPAPMTTEAPAATEAPEATAMPEATEVPAAAEATAVPAEEIPLGYIFVQANGDGGWIPLPTTDEDLLITIGRENDETIKNTLRLTRNGFMMDSSTCDNQDCVQQGEVTLENKDDRVLMHMVLCLPHNVSVELYSLEEILVMMAESAQVAQ